MPTKSPPSEELAIALKKNEKVLKAPKRHGIRQRMMFFLVIFVCAILAMLWICQIFLLNDFYRFFKTQDATRTADTVVANLEDDDLESIINQLAIQNNLCIMVLDENMNTLYSAEGQSFCMIHAVRSHDLRWWCNLAPEDGSARLDQFDMTTPFEQGQNQFDNRFDDRRFSPNRGNDAQVLLYVRRVTLSDNSTGYLLLNSVISPVDATVSTLKSQLIIITVIVLVGAVLLAFLLSRTFSKPIIETTTNARELSRSRFTRAKHANSYTEIRELNDTLEKAAQDLSQVEHLQHELIANISHDLRTPLTMIGGYAEIMRDLPGEVTPENMQVIIDETGRLSTLVNELLDFSRMEAGMTQLNKQRFSLTETVKGIVSRCSTLIEKDGYTIVFEPEEELFVTADEGRIEQVVYNLVNNALTYTGEDKTVRLIQSVHDGRARLEVRDSGKGISDEELPLIWNRYYRAKESHKRAVQGSGLGLSIVRTILENHGAPYGVTSKQGEGTCFWFELDQSKETQEAK